jgi:hypothetical protein
VNNTKTTYNIKPLVWQTVAESGWAFEYETETPVGWLRVWSNGTHHKWWYSISDENYGWRKCETLAECFQKAEEWYIDRVKEMLEVCK